jgi:protoporphyrinogen oxidase
MIVILGAGLAGMSAAFHLKKREFQIFEREEVGGLCRSVVQDGFTFDYTDHLLHIHNGYTRELLEILIPNLLGKHQRRAAICLGDRYIPYPFQANLWALPKEMNKECLLGYIQAYGTESKGEEDFMSWIYQAFGSGIAKYFMIPYNEKLWRIPLSEISLEWVERFVPRPSIKEMIDGALGTNLKGFGYNKEFLYPLKGGINVLPQAFQRMVGDVHIGKEAESIDIEKRVVKFKDGSEVAYSTLISSLPLNELLERIITHHEEINKLREHLRFVSVLNINVGVKRGHISEYHWIYYPEPRYPFYRVGFPSNLSPHMAPKGTSSLSVEISYLPHIPLSVEEVQEKTLSALISCGILRDDDEILAKNALMIKHAYVIYDAFRSKHIPKIIHFLRSQSIYPIGRYGLWRYSTMEEAILQGRDVAEALP